MGEMQEKMEIGLQELDQIKFKNAEELKRFNEFLKDKVQRMENDYNKKIGDQNDRFNEALLSF